MSFPGMKSLLITQPFIVNDAKSHRVEQPKSLLILFVSRLKNMLQSEHSPWNQHLNASHKYNRHTAASSENLRMIVSKVTCVLGGAFNNFL